MRRVSLVSLWIVSLCLQLAPAAFAGKSLEIYFIDVEGGQSTLVVDPQGESLLIDTGWPGFNGRDADRIMRAVKASGIDHIDYVVITHYHSDHVGGVRQLASHIKIGAFADHGPNTENSAEMLANYAAYEKVAARSKRIVLKPGDTIPFQRMDVQVLTSAGEEIRTPLAGAGQQNPLCASEPAAPADPSENGRSVGVLITYGKFRFIDLGDLTTRGELGLACPRNLIGTVDLYLTTHHGTAHPGTGDSSNAPAIVDALHPRVAIMNNGAIKGGHPLVWQTVHDSPGLEDLWQLHYAILAGKEHNVAEAFIANIVGNDDGNYIKVSAQPNATFTVVNSRNNFAKTYIQ
jgi:beta-lactamase superfamily II metal-dependent hydrolase